jgi:hypothetical protein
MTEGSVGRRLSDKILRLSTWRTQRAPHRTAEFNHSQSLPQDEQTPSSSLHIATVGLKFDQQGVKVNETDAAPVEPIAGV